MANKNELYINVWIGNLGKYNGGELIGEWFKLPVDMEEVAAKIGLNEQYEEYQINDYETNLQGLEIHHYENINNLNELAEQLDSLEEYQQLILQAYIENYGVTNLFAELDTIDFDNARIWYEVESLTDIAYEVIEGSGLLNSMPENLQCYFDYEAFGRDLGIEGTFVFLDNGICVEFFN